MPKITFIDNDGNARSVDAKDGQSVMSAAVDHLLPGIVADCGGSCACATCHVYVDDAWADKVPAASEDERAMIDCAINVRDSSRLSCQIRMTRELDGLQVHTPASQI